MTPPLPPLRFSSLAARTFGEIAAATAGKGTSVILFRLQNKRTAFVIQRLAWILETCRLALENGAVVAVEDSRHRIRQLPIGKTERNV
jgi:hypothetical protein